MDYMPYLREDKFPHIWCEGCGDGIALKAIIRAVDTLKLDKNKVAMVSGIGCSSRTPGYADFNTLHTTHGRAIAFATGLKMARSDLDVLVVSGDGDATAIGGNHLIHAARRNINLTVLLYNNHIYGMTGGQASPTTPIGDYATTAPYGGLENNFDIAGLVIAAGASFVARATVFHAKKLEKIIQKAIEKKGFSLVEIMSPCPTAYGKINKKGRGKDLILEQKHQAVGIERTKNMTPEELQGKIITGVLMDRELPEYIQTYDKVIAQAQAQAQVDKNKETIMSFRYEIRLSGAGGQGLILIGKILAEAAAIYDDKNATQSQSYGPEARGGASRSEVIISDGDIDYPKATNIDLLLALTQEAVDKYSYDVKKAGIIIVDTGFVKKLPEGDFKIYDYEITKMAEDKLGKKIVANIIALGIIVEVTGIISKEAILHAIRARVPKGTEEANIRAFEYGTELVLAMTDN